MTEHLPGIYEVKLSTTNTSSISEINIYLIPGKNGQRSLMVDAGFHDKACLEVMDGVLKELKISYGELDIFLTHKHHDHSGLASEYAKLGARIFMNPEEERHGYDCLYYSNNRDLAADQDRVLKSVGVTSEGTPEIWDMFMEVRRQVEENRGWEFEVASFPYIPVQPGQLFHYGEYTFESVSLKGHTYGQMGLYEKKRRFLFCADEVIDGIVPIVGTTYADDHLLEGYFKVLERFKHEYGDCLLLPAHNKPIRDVERVVNRIIFSYLDKTELMKNILDHGRKERTIKEIACIAYGIPDVPRNKDEFLKLKATMSKTFSCLEYLRDEDFAVRMEKGGTFYWYSFEQHGGR